MQMLKKLMNYSFQKLAKPVLRDLNDIPKEPGSKNKIPIITTKRKELNFYVGDKFNKFKPELVTNGWLHPKSKTKHDYFLVHPLQTVIISYLNRYNNYMSFKKYIGKITFITARKSARKRRCTELCRVGVESSDAEESGKVWNRFANGYSIKDT